MKPIEEKLYEALYNILEIVCVDCKSDYKVNGVCTGCPRVVAARKALAEASGRRCPMANKYTSYQMRVGSKACYEAGHRTVAGMLQQAAEVMEREEREKKYEYSVKEFGGYVQPLHEDSVSLSFLDGRAIGDENYVIVRRVVGEWEEVEA